MDTQKTIIKVLELFKTLAILYGLSWVIFATTAFYYINHDESPQQSSTPVSTPKIDKAIELSESALKGKALFKSLNCEQCHAASNEVVVGPGLKGIEERRKTLWLREWIRNSQKVLKSGDKYAVELFNKYNRTPMLTYPGITDKDIDAILKYIEEVNQ